MKKANDLYVLWKSDLIDYWSLLSSYHSFDFLGDKIQKHVLLTSEEEIYLNLNNLKFTHVNNNIFSVFSEIKKIKENSNTKYLLYLDNPNIVCLNDSFLEYSNAGVSIIDDNFSIAFLNLETLDFDNLEYQKENLKEIYLSNKKSFVLASDINIIENFCYVLNYSQQLFIKRMFDNGIDWSAFNASFINVSNSENLKEKGIMSKFLSLSSIQKNNE